MSVISVRCAELMNPGCASTTLRPHKHFTTAMPTLTDATAPPRELYSPKDSGYTPQKDRLRAAARLVDLPTELEVLDSFEVRNRRGRVLARLVPSRGPDGCGIDFLMPIGPEKDVLRPAGSVGVPSSMPSNLMVGVARRLAEQMCKYNHPTAKIIRLPAKGQAPREAL